MKITKYVGFPLTYAICLVLLSNEALAKQSTTQQIEDISNWTQDQVQSYLHKYNIIYDKNDENLLETVKRYRDTAVANANLFITDKADSVTRLIEGLRIQLEKHHHLASNSIQGLTNDLSHELKQLELTGQLTQDKVKQALEQYEKKAIDAKYVTQAQWKDISKDIESSFAPPTWYQRLLGSGPSHSKLFDEDSFHTWVSNSITNRVQENKELTKQQVADVVQTIQHAVQSTSSSVQDFPKLATVDWWKKLAEDIEVNAKLQKNQVEKVIDSLRDEITSYKIFVIDYAGEKADITQNMISYATQYIMDKGQGIYQAVIRPLQKINPKAKVNEALSTAYSAGSYATDAAYSAGSYATDAAASATDAAASSASSLGCKATDSVEGIKKDVLDHIDDAKYSFGNLWRQQEFEAYRKLGYTEAHVNWIENYLSKTFLNKKYVAQDTIRHAIQTIRNYLIEARIQTTANIDARLQALESFLNRWIGKAPKTEL